MTKVSLKSNLVGQLKHLHNQLEVDAEQALSTGAPISYDIIDKSLDTLFTDISVNDNAFDTLLDHLDDLNIARLADIRDELLTNGSFDNKRDCITALDMFKPEYADLNRHVKIGSDGHLHSLDLNDVSELVKFAYNHIK